MNRQKTRLFTQIRNGHELKAALDDVIFVEETINIVLIKGDEMVVVSTPIEQEPVEEKKTFT